MKSNSRYSLLVLCFFTAGIQENARTKEPASDLTAYVNPFIGTDRGGNTYPGAQAPFGMVQLNPDCGGICYQYKKLTMHGFSLTMFSGAGGGGEYGTPFFTASIGDVKVDEALYDYSYDHKNESASPGYYSVLMNPSGIKAELTATTRCGMARFSFPAGQQANVLLPISKANTKVFSSKVDLVDAHTLTGETKAAPFWGGVKPYGGKPIAIYFAMKLDKAISRYGTWTEDKITANSNRVEQQGVCDNRSSKKNHIGFYVSYPASTSPMVVNVRIGISYVSVEGAINNLNAEMPDANFDAYRAQTVAAWNKELGIIKIKDNSETHKQVFYTALYHTLLYPTIFDDADGSYVGFDEVVRKVPEGHQHIYANFSGWDIYRSEWPLLCLIEPERAQDMAQSMVEMYKQIGYFSRWPQANRPTICMGGYPLTTCLVHAWNAGLKNFDIAKAYEGMLKVAIPTPFESRLIDRQWLEDRGPWLNADSNTSYAQEACIAFSALGHLATRLNKQEDANFLFGRALQYRTFYNPRTGFFQSRDDRGEWLNPDWEMQYDEGNKWIYRWLVPHDVQGMVDLMGGFDAFEAKLDQFFAEKHYNPTNEPDIQAPFLYDYIGRPWKTQKIVAETADKCFTNEPGGLAGGGNDDAGTMSAWYVFSQLGIYPVDPGVPYYEMCTPRFTEAVLHFGMAPDAKTFTIAAPEASTTNVYIQSAELNGTAFKRPWLEQKDILAGGKLKVSVGPQPNLSWGNNHLDHPYSLSTGLRYLPEDVVTSPLVPAAGEELVWNYVTEKPAVDWMKPDFSDAQWQKGPAGFGVDYKYAKIATQWTSDELWMRTTFELKDVPARVALSVHKTHGIEVYLNGAPLMNDKNVKNNKYNTLKIIATDPDTNACLRPGKNVLAIHATYWPRGDKGRRYLDAVLLNVTPRE